MYCSICQYKCLFLLSFPNAVFVPGCVHAAMCVDIYVCLRVCVYDCLGSQRVTEPEFDEGTAVVSKGGWGLFPSFTCSVSQSLYSYVVLFWL